MTAHTLRIHPGDNVAVALSPIATGTHFAEDCVAVEPIPTKHKVCTQTILEGTHVIMYGVPVGIATCDLERGMRLSTRRIKHDTAPYTVRSNAYRWTPPDVSRWEGRTFEGYYRSDGQVGTANHWLTIPLVFCENHNVDVLRRAFEDELGYSRVSPYRKQVAALARAFQSGSTLSDIHDDAPARLFPNVDGIHFLTHQGGCGGTRQDARTLCGLFAGYLNHPNVCGATILSLGCENAQIDLLLEELALRNPNYDKPLFVFRQQDYPSTDRMLTEAIVDTFSGLVEANQQQRKSAPLSKLTIGLECGGSDGFSGISSNPAIGHASDLLVSLGGRTILAEFPELCGVEQALIDRCVTVDLADKFATLMRDYAELAQAVGSGFDMNPSPGNIRDGLLTDAMKSAGAARKGGTSPVTAVLDYPEYATVAGLNLLCTPGGDVESTTGLAGAGAQIILFSTGLGTPTGNPVAQVIKISSNSNVAERLSDLIDLDAGGVIDGRESIEDAGEAILELTCKVASGGVKTCASTLCQHDFIPWKRGVSL